MAQDVLSEFLYIIRID